MKKVRVVVLKREGEMWESNEKIEKVIAREGWIRGGKVRAGDIVIIMGNSKRILRAGKDEEIEKIMKKDVRVIGICYGMEYLAWRSGGEIEEGVKIKGNREGKWYNHNDRVVKLGKGWRGTKKRGMYIEGRTRKWKGYQYHPEHNKETMKEMLKEIDRMKREMGGKSERSEHVVKDIVKGVSEATDK
jgi:GMP synthase-like glutamine amidotransferase